MFTKSLIKINLLIISFGFLLFLNVKILSAKRNYLNDNNINLKEAVNAIERGVYGNVHSLLIFKNDEIVLEKYFNGWTPDSLHMLQSATKSVISTLMGIAIKEGYVKSLDSKVLPYFSHLNIENIDSLKSRITIEDLLTQRHGLKWVESPWDSPDNSWRKILKTDGNWYKMILDTPMGTSSGTTFNYSNAAPVLLAGIIQNSSGMAIDSFANKYLFKPLNIKKFKFWDGNGGAEHNGSALLYLRPKDMIKIGQLYLQNGQWNNKQILQKGWTELAAETPIIKNYKDNMFYRFGYSYLWWNSPKAIGNRVKLNENVYLARGAGGQYIIIDPDEEMVVVITAWDLQNANFIFEIFTKFLQSDEYQKKNLPELFAKQILTDKVETSVTLTPDESELYFAKKDSFYANNQKNTIYVSNLINGSWTSPKVASFSGEYSDSSPFVTTDGKRLYFCSNRPKVANLFKNDRDIWYVERIGDSWSEPIHNKIYNSEKSEYSPTLDEKGNLYFGSYREGGYGSGDIWVSYLKSGNYLEPENLGISINTKLGEWGSCISPNGDYIVFEASGRSQNISYDGDLYISKKREGIWQSPINLEFINSSGSDLSPKIHNDHLYFASNRHDVFSIEINNNNVELYRFDLKKAISIE